MKCIYLLNFVLIFSFANSQELSYINYTNNNGLPSNEVFGMAIDQKGYLWACTDKGISKFDGSNFTNFTSLNGLNDNVFFNITHDYKDRIWLWSYNQKYNYILDGKIHNYKYNSLIRKIIKNNYFGSTIGVGKKDKIFFSISGKNFSITNVGIVEFYDNIIFGKDYIITIKGNQMKNEGIKKFDLSKMQNNTWFKKRNNNGYPFSLYSDNEVHYFSYMNELLILNNGNTRIKTFTNYIESLCVDNKKRIWISFTLNNLELYQTLDDNNPKIIFKKSSGKLIKDRNGNIWFSDSYKGLFKFQNGFVENHKIFDANIMVLLLPKKQSILLKSYNNSFSEYYFSSQKLTKTNEKLCYDALSFVKEIEFNNGKIEFYGTFHTAFLYKKDSISSIKTIQKTEEQYIFGTGDSFFILNPNKGTCKKHATNVEMTKDICYIDDEHIFLATIDGVYIKNITNNTIKKVNDKICTDEHTQVIKRLGNYLLFGTKGKGLVVYSLVDKRVISYYHKDNSEMPNSINAIHINNNKIYIGSNQGIFIYRFQNGFLHFENILNKNSGILSNDVLGIYIKENILYCIAENMLNCIDLNNPDVFKLPIPNSPEILSIKVNDKLVSNQNLIVTEYDKNDIEIHFNSAYLLDKTRINYFYKLSNFDSKWYSTKVDNLHFNNLPPGTYYLMLYTAFDNGKIKSKIKSIRIVVSQPFWMSTSFKLIVIILLLIISFGLISFYFYSKSERSKKRMQIIEYQQKALRAQIKPHFIFNALNSIQNFVLKKKVDNALDFIEKFSTLTRSILDTSEHEYTTLQNELATTQYYMDIEKIRFNNFDYKVILSDNINVETILIPSLLLQPIVENAIWHGLQNKSEDDLGVITLSISTLEECKLLLEIEDNGIGRKASKKASNHDSKGLSLLKKRLDLLRLKDAYITFEDLYQNGIAAGTKVIIKLPLIKTKNHDTISNNY